MHPHIPPCIALQAMAMGLPTVVTNWSAPTEYLRRDNRSDASILKSLFTIACIYIYIYIYISHTQLKCHSIRRIFPSFRRRVQTLRHYTHATPIDSLAGCGSFPLPVTAMERSDMTLDSSGHEVLTGRRLPHLFYPRRSLIMVIKWQLTLVLVVIPLLQWAKINLSHLCEAMQVRQYGGGNMFFFCDY